MCLSPVRLGEISWLDFELGVLGLFVCQVQAALTEDAPAQPPSEGAFVFIVGSCHASGCVYVAHVQSVLDSRNQPVQRRTFRNRTWCGRRFQSHRMQQIPSCLLLFSPSGPGDIVDVNVHASRSTLSGSALLLVVSVAGQKMPEE